MQFKACSDCQQQLPIEHFAYLGGGRNGLQSTCKPCTLERLRDHRKFTRELVGRYKRIKGCAHCGVKLLQPCQYDLDHIDPTTKRNKQNTRAFEPSWSLKRIKEELRKCQVLCKNCHALKTYRDKDYLNHTNTR